MMQINRIPHPVTLNLPRPTSPVLDLKWGTLTRKATGADFSVFDLTRPWFEPPTFHTRREGSHYRPSSKLKIIEQV